MLFNPLYYPEVLSRPFRRSNVRDSIPNIPVMAFLMAAHRPSTYYEIGVLFGDMYFYMCQIAAEMELKTKCVGIDIFDDSDPDCAHLYINSSAEVLPTLLMHNEAFSYFSTIIKADSKEYYKEVADNSIDLLFIDGDHSYQGVSSDFNNWLPKMSSRGIIAMHDINNEYTTQNFYVNTFWNEIKSRYPYYESMVYAGLGILLVGESALYHRDILTLTSTKDLNHLKVINDYFRRLGSLHREAIAPTSICTIRVG